VFSGIELFEKFLVASRVLDQIVEDGSEGNGSGVTPG
jgi:hypothetical protein